MSLLHWINQIDQELFLFLNGQHFPFMDQVMWQISGKFLWIPMYLVIIYFLVRERRSRVWIILIAIALMILLSDQLSVLVKDAVQRLRPSHNPLLLNLIHIVKEPGGNEYRAGTYGFVSSHAANTFALATFVSLFFARKWLTIAIFIWAAIVSYSRIYLGVHYPLDVVGGAMIGTFAGAIIFYLERFVQQKYFKDSDASPQPLEKP
jgi:undecaprenyl-diphosphatase